MPACLGVDYGLRRIGIAVGDTERSIAFAHGTHVEGRDGSVVAALRDLAADRGAETVVVGLPLTADGRETEMAAQARRFAGILERDHDHEVMIRDERYNSAETENERKS